MNTQRAVISNESQPAKPKLSDKEIQQLTQLLNNAINAYQASHEERLSIETVNALQQESLDLTNKVLSSDPFNVEALNLLARVRLDQNEIETSETFCQTALAIEPESATTWYTFGQIELAKGLLKEAEQAFIKCIRLDSTFFRAHTSYAYTKLQQGDVAAAYVHYQRLVKIRPNDFHIKSKLFECLGQLKADYDNEGLANDLLQYFQWEDVNHHNLSTITETLLIHRYQLNSDSAKVDLAKLCRDKLYNTALRKIFFCNPKIEELNTDLRSYFLNLSSNATDIDAIQLMTSLAMQFHNNEYVVFCSEEESQLVSSLSVSLNTLSINELHENQITLLKTLLFKPLKQILSKPQIDAILSRKDKFWQPDILELVKHLRSCDNNHEHTIPNFNAITDSISCAVKQQYEINPYPRWLTVDYHTPTTYGDALEKALPNYQASQQFHTDSLDVLIAGCGTGRHAIQVARYFRDVKVTAIDISLHSLSYAQNMASKYQLDNIEFIQADILNLGTMSQRFDIIECSGVLHHMEQPEVGAKILKGLLKEDGLLKVGLYSERARTEVIGCRQIIEENYDEINSEVIRNFRREVLKHGNDFPQILQSNDFYSMSGCRDLLFHVQEHRFTPKSIESLVNNLKMNFLGFVQVQGVHVLEYQKTYPSDKKRTNLDNWEEFEQLNPTVFSAMYQFYLSNA